MKTSNLVKLINWIINQPLNQNEKTKALFRFLRWQMGARLNPYPIIYPWVNNSKLIIKKGMTGATTNLYAGLHDFGDMSFLLHFLRKEDNFIDIGANVGVYTVLASGAIGAKSIAIEPIPSTFTNLFNNIQINHIKDLVDPLNIGLGKSEGKLKFTSSLDTMNHVSNNTGGEQNTINIQVKTLDLILTSKECPSLIKIDVEGFETEVLAGGENTLTNTDLKAIIIELNGSGERYGYKDIDIHNRLISKGFEPYLYLPFKRKLVKLETFSNEENTIYLRDIDFITKRVETAEKFHVFNKYI